MQTRTKQRRKTHRQAARELPSPRRRFVLPSLSTALVALLIAGAALFAYQTSFSGVFVFDDEFAIQRNPNIRSLWPLTSALSAPPESPVSARPVASLSLAVNYALAPADARDVMAPGGLGDAPDVTGRFLANVWGYHFANLALHVFAACAVMGLARRTLLSGRLRARFGSSATALAAIVAVLWAVHPLTTDAVTYVTQRTEVLMGLFYLLTLYCAIRAADPAITKWWRRWWTVGAMAACALGMGSKQTMVTAPFVVLLWDWVFGERKRLRWGLYAALAATWVILVAGLLVERWPTSIGMDREGWTPWTYLLTQAGVIVHYLRLAFFPAPLVIDYDGWPMARSVLDVAPQAALLLLLVGATLVGLVRRAPWSFAAAWFWALLAPSSSVLPLATEIAAERRMYTALVAVVVLVVIGVYAVGRRLRDSQAGAWLPQRLAPVAAVLVVTAVAATLAMVSRERNRDFWSEERIWQDAVEKRPDNPRARLNYGVILASQRRFGEAEEQLRTSLRLKEPVAKAHSNLGSILCAQGRFQEGVAHLERGLALAPQLPSAHANLAEAYGSLGRRRDAARHFREAVALEPDNVRLLNRLGWLLATSSEDEVRDASKAIEVGQRAVRLTGGQDWSSLDTLAAAYAEAGRFTEAAATARDAFDVAARQKGPTRELAYRVSLYAYGQRFRER